MNFDITDIQWWQALIAVISGLGLSPAPWLLGLATGKIQFTDPAQASFDGRVADLKASHVEALNEQDKNHERYTDELIAHHNILRSMDQDRYDEMKQSRDGYRTAAREQRDRADRATESAAQAVEAVQATNHLLESLAIVSREVVSDGQ